MLTDKEIKKKYRPIFWAEPEKYYATEVLKKEGFTRNICKKCEKPFWNVDKNKTICDDPSCREGVSFEFIGNTPATKSLTYIEVWQEFSKLMKEKGYTPIARYPTVARWNPTMEYTIASIAAFQPYVISGEIEPPAKKLVIPQMSVRFGDIDNIGITMSHFTGFVMIGQHQFVSPKEWNQNQAFKDLFDWFVQGLGIPKEELTMIEDVWSGGGNFGCCMEFFARGAELGNQVYMLYEQTPTGVQELNIKVLDMGMGMERNAWFSQGSATAFDATFPAVMEKLFHATGFTPDQQLLQDYVPHAGLLNLDETENIEESWNEVARRIGVETKKLKNMILPLSGIYSIADHSRTLLFTLNDGALPSNTGGGYNLRVLVRRALSFIDKYNWNIYLPEVCKWHAEYLKPLFPELTENLKEIEEILENEREKYESTKQKSKQIVQKIINEDITTEKLLELYDSQGITPELIREAASKLGKEIEIPADFYIQVSERHEKKEQIHATKTDYIEGFENLKETKAGYFEGYEITEFDAKIVRQEERHVVLDKTYFYPTSGGQIHDEGTINGEKIKNVFKQGNLIIHELEKEHKFSEGEKVHCVINEKRRYQLAKHHTAAHIINAAARKVLGNHINQAGAKKTLEKGHLDITHYKSLTTEEIEAIEKEANRIVDQGIEIEKKFMPRGEAEKEYGMTIYQGGAVPGKELRIVNIIGTDVECCGGTHLHNTKEAKPIKIIKTSKISDAIIRIEYKAGPAAIEESNKEQNIVEELAKELDCETKQVPGRSKELFEIWKNVIKKKKESDKKLKSTEEYEGDIIEETSKMLKTQPENLLKTIKRFKKDLNLQ